MDRWIDRQIDKKIDRQIDRYLDRQISYPNNKRVKVLGKEVQHKIVSKPLNCIMFWVAQGCADL